MGDELASVLGSWDYPSSPTMSTPSRVAKRLVNQGRPGHSFSSRVRRLARIFSVSPLLFAFAPNSDPDLTALLGGMEFAADSPHAPTTLNGNQRRFLALVDRVIKEGEILVSSSTTQSLTKFLDRFQQLPSPMTPSKIAETVEGSDFSHLIFQKIAENSSSSSSSSSSSPRERESVDRCNLSESQVYVIVFYVFSVLCRVLLDPEGVKKTYSLLSDQHPDVVRELRDKGNRFSYEREGGDEEDDRDLRRAANFYTAALAASPFDYKSYLNRATVFFKRKEFDYALADASRVHILDSKCETANYLMGECLYQMGEVEAAKMLNLHSTPTPLSGLADSVFNDASQLTRQRDRWTRDERKAKDKLERVLKAASMEYISRWDPLGAIDAYGRVDDVIEEYGHATLDIITIDLAVMDYCRSLAYVASGIPYYINCAVEKMEAIIDNPEVLFPLAFLALGKAFKKMKMYPEAIHWAKRGHDMSRRGVRVTGGRHNWPGTHILIEESKKDKMEEALLSVVTSCQELMDSAAISETLGSDFYTDFFNDG